MAIRVLPLLEEPAGWVAQPPTGRFEAGAAPWAQQALHQPGAERVQPVDPAHVDRDAADLLPARAGRVDQRLERAGVLDRPRARGGKLQPPARHRALKRRRGGPEPAPLSMPAPA